jgi:cell wall-associated NlpC family hydrolase
VLQDLTRQALALGAEKLELQEMLAQQGAELDDALAARGAAAAAAAAAAARAQALSRQARAPAPAASAEGAGKSGRCKLLRVLDARNAQRSHPEACQAASHAGEPQDAGPWVPKVL